VILKLFCRLSNFGVYLVIFGFWVGFWGIFWYNYQMKLNKFFKFRWRKKREMPFMVGFYWIEAIKDLVLNVVLQRKKSSLKQRLLGFLKNVFKGKFRGGFSLIEILVAISVLTMVLAAATNVLVGVTRTNDFNMDTVVGYGLAQEGVEVVRNLRDSNALIGAKFDGSGADGKALIGEEKLFEGGGGDKWFVLKENSLCVEGFYCPGVVLGGVVGGFDFASAKKSLESGNVEVLSEVEVFKKNEGEVVKFVQGDAGGELKKTGFYRVIRVKSLELDKALCVAGVCPLNEKLQVDSIVFWRSSEGRVREIVLSTELTDWHEI